MVSNIQLIENAARCTHYHPAIDEFREQLFESSYVDEKNYLFPYAIMIFDQGNK